MRLANVSDRLALVAADGGSYTDAERATGGRVPADPQAVYEHWDDYRELLAAVDPASAEPLDRAQLECTVPAPRQIFAIGLNYRQHAAETQSVVPETPMVFTKFASSLGRPDADVPLPEGRVDWEVELVVVIGRRAHRVAATDAWTHVAGLTVGQDISERDLQHAGTPPQFSLGKSFPNFGPVGPWLVTPDEFDDPDDLELGCLLNGQHVQKARTSELIFTVPQLVSELSQVTPLLPGDLIFTGTPAGVGLGATPPHFLDVGDELVSYVTGIGEIRNRMVALPGVPAS